MIQLKIWWIPQIPMKAFEVKVYSIAEAKRILDTLAKYDTFQLENHIKPDFSNAGGLLMFEEGEWVEWCDEEGNSIDDLI